MTALARRVHGGLTPGDGSLFAQGDDRLERVLRADGGDLDRPVPARAVRRLGAVRQPADAAGDGADVRRRVPAPLSPASGVRAGDARRRDERLLAARRARRPTARHDAAKRCSGPARSTPTIARRDGVAISRRQYLADAAALAERLPPTGAMLNLSVDRYRFAVGLGAAMLRGHACLLPPNHTPHTVERLRSRFAGAYALVEAEGEGDGLPSIVHGRSAAVGATAPANPRLAADRVAAHVLTSGSTGDPVPHAKPWGLLAASARAEAARLAEAMRPRLAGRPHPGRRRCRRSTCTASSRACCSPCTAARRSTPGGRSIRPTSSPRSPPRRRRGRW